MLKTSYVVWTRQSNWEPRFTPALHRWVDGSPSPDICWNKVITFQTMTHIIYLSLVTGEVVKSTLLITCWYTSSFWVKYPNTKYFQTVHSLQFQLQSSFVADRCPSSLEPSSSKNSTGIPPPPLSVLGSPGCPFSLEGVSHCRPVVSLQNSIRAIGSHFQLFLPFPPQLPSPGLSREFRQDEEGRKRKPPWRALLSPARDNSC